MKSSTWSTWWFILLWTWYSQYCTQLRNPSLFTNNKRLLRYLTVMTVSRAYHNDMCLRSDCNESHMSRTGHSYQLNIELWRRIRDESHSSTWSWMVEKRKGHLRLYHYETGGSTGTSPRATGVLLLLSGLRLVLGKVMGQHRVHIHTHLSVGTL